ncbi:hypothetical protein J2D73_20255, partial [Acetobacter sacchari]
MTHTPYQRGRRAAERGSPRTMPDDVIGSDCLLWLAGYDSTGSIPISADEITAMTQALDECGITVADDEVAPLVA